MKVEKAQSFLHGIIGDFGNSEKAGKEHPWTAR